MDLEAEIVLQQAESITDSINIITSGIHARVDINKKVKHVYNSRTGIIYELKNSLVSSVSYEYNNSAIYVIDLFSKYHDEIRNRESHRKILRHLSNFTKKRPIYSKDEYIDKFLIGFGYRYKKEHPLKKRLRAFISGDYCFEKQ